MKQVRYDQPVLRDLNAAGFDENRQGVMMSGCTWDREVQVIVYLIAIKMTFPKVASAKQCISFVKRNLDQFRGLVNDKLLAGNTAEFEADSN